LLYSIQELFDKPFRRIFKRLGMSKEAP
jgi:hypothetical protein